MLVRLRVSWWSPSLSSCLQGVLPVCLYVYLVVTLSVLFTWWSPCLSTCLLGGLFVYTWWLPCLSSCLFGGHLVCLCLLGGYLVCLRVYLVICLHARFPVHLLDFLSSQKSETKRDPERSCRINTKDVPWFLRTDGLPGQIRAFFGRTEPNQTP